MGTTWKENTLSHEICHQTQVPLRCLQPRGWSQFFLVTPGHTSEPKDGWGKPLLAFPGSFSLLLLLLSHFSRVRLCATPQTAAHQAPSSLGFSRQEHWSGLPFPSLSFSLLHLKCQPWSRNASQSWPGLLPPSFPQVSGRSRGDRCSLPLLLTCSWLLILRRMALPPLHFVHSYIPRLAHDGRKEQVAQREGRRQRQWQEWTAFTATTSGHPAWDSVL